MCVCVWLSVDVDVWMCMMCARVLFMCQHAISSHTTHSWMYQQAIREFACSILIMGSYSHIVFHLRREFQLRLIHATGPRDGDLQQVTAEGGQVRPLYLKEDNFSIGDSRTPPGQQPVVRTWHGKLYALRRGWHICKTKMSKGKYEWSVEQTLTSEVSIHYYG